MFKVTTVRKFDQAHGECSWPPARRPPGERRGRPRSALLPVDGPVVT